jgi:CRISPR/Cas system-associated endonuclease Cas1
MKIKKFSNGFKVDFSTKHRIEFTADWLGAWETEPKPLVALRIYDRNVRSLKPHNKYCDIGMFSTLQEAFNFLQSKCKTNLKQKVKDELQKLEAQILTKLYEIPNQGITELFNQLGLISTEVSQNIERWKTRGAK